MAKSAIGEIALDNSGAALGVARLSVEKSYQGIGNLLKQVIEDGDKAAWSQIKDKVDYTYENMTKAMETLEREEPFLEGIKVQIAQGKKLLFKPNIVTVECIEPYSHLHLKGTTANTEWSFVAALMRWFHDQGVAYHQMCLGEAASNSIIKAAQYTIQKGGGRTVTTEAAYEGRSDDFYGGWGFYFARKYLAEALPDGADENPMLGLEESMAGEFIAPGESGKRLMFYDLNRLHDDPSKGREVPLPDGENFKSIILHKVIVGGDPDDRADMKRYPGCVLLNLPKLKVHSQALYTNAIKNLGIGLYPLQANQGGSSCWAYGTPDTDIPTIKSRIPHQVWVPELDPDTHTPIKDENGDYKVVKTGGLTGTMLDIIRATANQNVTMMHIVDGIESVNKDHQGTGLGEALPEGLIVAGNDVVAVDLLCARYIFSNVGLEEASQNGPEDGFGGRFPQKVPLPMLQDGAIKTSKAYDCPIARDYSMHRAVEYGMGQSAYYVAGWDDISGNPLVSAGGRLGYLAGDEFSDIHTKYLYWDIYKLPWDLQKTFLGYLDAVDELEDTSLKADFIKEFDETGDGVVSYEENGKKGVFGPALFLGGQYISSRGDKAQEKVFHNFFALIANPLRAANPAWSAQGHHFNKEFFCGTVTVAALGMSALGKQFPDAKYKDMTWGMGQWPSFSQARDAYLYNILYGWRFPKQVGMFSLYGCVFGYADRTMNGSRFVGDKFAVPNAKAPQQYLEALQKGETKPLDFMLYVPEGYGVGGKLPHVKETSDPAKAFTAEIDGGRIVWDGAVVC